MIQDSGRSSTDTIRSYDMIIQFSSDPVLSVIIINPLGELALHLIGLASGN